MASLKEQALRLAAEHGLVVLPCREKYAKGLSGWQTWEKSYEGKLWDVATGFGISAGKHSGVTIIDVDAPDRKWFDAFWAQSGCTPTTTVETPSGGLHLYYKYDPRIKTTTKLDGYEIDVRNDRSLIMAPGSPYEAKGPKAKFNGKLYEFQKGLDWSVLQPMDDIWFQFQQFGVDRETFKVKPPKQPKKVVVSRDSTNGRKDTNRDHFMALMLEYNRKFDSRDNWLTGIWSICRVAHDNGFCAMKFADEWSSKIGGYTGSKAVASVVSSFNLDKAIDCGMGLPYILSKLPPNNEARIEFLKNFRRQYYFLDHVSLLARNATEGHIKLVEVHDFLSTAMIKVVRAGTPFWYLRYRCDNGVDDWALFKGTGNPFKGDNKGAFTYLVPKTPEEIQKEKDKGVENPETVKRVESSFNVQLVKHQYTKIPTYTDIVFRPYYGDVPPCHPDTFNAFPGYKHRAYSDEEVDELLTDPVVKKRIQMVLNHWEETMCNNNKEMANYVLNWLAWLLRYGWKKPKVFLVFIGKPGLGKNLMWEDLVVHGILGKSLGHVVQDMKRFQSNFNMQRLNKCLHIFNECTCIQSNNRVNWDQMKSLTELHFTAEPKGKESFCATDPAGNVFLSNQKMPVNVANDDRRYAVTSMNPKYKANRKYWNRLVAAIQDERVQRLFFTGLVNRDLSGFVMQDIPETNMRLQLKKNKSKNHVLTFLERVVTVKGFVPWYRDNIEKAEFRYFSKARVRASFYDYLEDNSIPKRFQPWTTIEDRLKDAGLTMRRVTDRSDDGQKRQVLCYRLDKQVVRDIHRKMLEDPAWEFEKIEVSQGGLMDADR